MMNYVKSEFYRVLHSRDIYYFTGVLAILSFLLNAIIWFFGKDDNGFRYNTTSFSYSNLVANPMFFCVMAALIGIMLYEGNRKNGNLKNTIAFGISRTKVFVSQCMVATVISVVSLIIILTVYITSAILFLEHTGPVSLTDLLTEIPAVFLVAVASLISIIFLIEASGKDITGIIIWVVVWFVIPQIFYYLGLRIAICHKIAMWMPANFFGTNVMSVNMSQSITAWGTAAGMAKCLIAGFIGIVIFSLSGTIVLRKKEI